MNTGLFDTVFFGYNAWFDEGRLVLTYKPEPLPESDIAGVKKRVL